MGAVQSLVLSSEGAAAATTLVIAGAVGYRISKMVKPQGEESGGKGEGRTKETPGESRSSLDAGKARKKKSKKRAAGAQAAETGTSDVGATTSAQVVPGGFDVAAAPNAPTKDTSKSKGKGKAKQALGSSGRAGNSPQIGDGGDDDASSATPSEAPPPPATSASGSKSKKSKKRKKTALGASSSTSILTLPNASSSKTTLSASNPGAVEPSAVPVSNPGTTGAAIRAEETHHGSKSKKPLHSGDASTTEDNEDDGKPFLASLSSSRQQAIGRTPLVPSLAMQSGPYPDTDSSWTHVRRGGLQSRRENSSSGLGQLSTSDAGVVSSVTDDGYPSSSPVAERAEDTEEDEAEEQAQDLGLGNSYVRASGDYMQRKTLAERLLPKPRKTGVEDMLETPDHPTLSRVVRVRPMPGEKPVTGFSWADYEDVHADEGAGHDADGEDDGWGVVRSRRSRPDHSSFIGATSSTDVNAPSRTAQAKSSVALNKKQRQNAKKREAAKAAKADAEADRLAAFAKHKQQLEKERLMEQLSKGSKAPSGGMHASVDDNGKLVWE